jgi:hypothetical protein
VERRADAGYGGDRRPRSSAPGQVVSRPGPRLAGPAIGLDLPIRLVRSTFAEPDATGFARARCVAAASSVRCVDRVQLNFHSSRASEYDLTLDALQHLQLFLPVFLNRTLLRVRMEGTAGGPGRRLPWFSPGAGRSPHQTDVEPRATPDGEHCQRTFLGTFYSVTSRSGARGPASSTAPDLLPAFDRRRPAELFVPPGSARPGSPWHPVSASWAWLVQRDSHHDRCHALRFAGLRKATSDPGESLSPRSCHGP